MKNVKGLITIVTLMSISSVAVAIVPFYVDPQLRNTNYSNFMRGYPYPEYQIITPDNLINMDWLKGAAAAVYNDGYTYDNDTAMALWRHMTNVVNVIAQRYPNQEEMKTRLWQALTRSLEELRRQRAQRQQVQPRLSAQPTYTSSATTIPAMLLDKEGILNGALGSAYAAKLGDILNYNDARSIKEGLIGLASAITTNINTINEESTPRTTKMIDLKRAIDAIYNQMLQKRAQD
jgi:hypothetical protein